MTQENNGKSNGKSRVSLHGLFDRTRENLPHRLTPASKIDYESGFVSLVNPSGGKDQYGNIYYASDISLQGPNQANTYRMIYDLSILAPLFEVFYALCSLPYSVLPYDIKDSRQKYAADSIKGILDEWPEFQSFMMNLAWAIYYGRQGAVIDYDWDFSYGPRKMIPKGWFPVHGDTLLFDSYGFAGILTGPWNADIEKERYFSCVEGWGVRVPPQEKEAWVVHSNLKLPGEWRDYRTGGRVWGQGLRDFLYPTYIAKNALWDNIYQFCDSFGNLGRIIYYYEFGSDPSYQTMADAAQKAMTSYTLLLPRQAGQKDAAEGVEVVQPPSGLMDLVRMIEKFESWNRLAICGQELTAESHNTGLGSKTAHTHQSTFARLINFHARQLQGTITQQMVRVLQKYNGFSDVPPLRFEFSLDLRDSQEKIESALKLHQMGVVIDQNELLQAAGFEIPTELGLDTGKEDVTDVENDIGASTGVD